MRRLLVGFARMISALRIRANRVSRDADDCVALTIAQVFVGHDRGITTLLAATVRLNPEVPHEASVRPPAGLLRAQSDRGVWRDV
jgi:hypothetical protein